MQYIMDYKNILFLRKNVYLRQRRPKLSPRLGTSRITQWNQILKNFVNDLNEQTELFTVSELHANISSFEEKDLHVYFILRKRFSRQAESFLAFLQYEARMFLKCVLIIQVQMTILKIPMFLCSCAEEKKQNDKRADPCAIKAFQQLQKV